MPNEKAPKKQVSVTIDGDLADWLEREAADRTVGRTLLVENALRLYLPQLPPLPSRVTAVTSTAVIAAIDSLRPAQAEEG